MEFDDVDLCELLPVIPLDEQWFSLPELSEEDASLMCGSSAAGSAPTSPFDADFCLLPLPLSIQELTTDPSAAAHSCSVCAKRFTSAADLSRHVMLVHDPAAPRPFACWHCEKAFALKHDLKRHLLVHEDDSKARQFACQACGKAFKLKAQLTRHELSHSNERAFTCQLCGKKYRQQADLTRHRATHVEVRAYSCSCGKAFKQRAHLVAHERRQQCLPVYENHGEASLVDFTPI